MVLRIRLQENSSRSHEINLLDILTTSSHCFHRKCVGLTNENLSFDLSVLRVDMNCEYMFSCIYWLNISPSLSIKRSLCIVKYELNAEPFSLNYHRRWIRVICSEKMQRTRYLGSQVKLTPRE